jgi:hypothetical protein
MTMKNKNIEISNLYLRVEKLNNLLSKNNNNENGGAI